MTIMLGDVSVKELHGPISDLMDKIQGEDGRAVFHEFKKFLRREPCWVAGGKTVAKKSVDSPLTKRLSAEFGVLETSLDMDAFYQIRAGLYVWPDFLQYVVVPARADTTMLKLKKLWYHDLTRSAKDALIEAHLGKQHIFGDREVVLLVASLVSNQKNGEAGVLLNDGKANLFYTKSRVVCVYWFSDDRRWSVLSYARGGHFWSVGHRVFSRN